MLIFCYSLADPQNLEQMVKPELVEQLGQQFKNNRKSNDKTSYEWIWKKMNKLVFLMLIFSKHINPKFKHMFGIWVNVIDIFDVF